MCKVREVVKQKRMGYVREQIQRKIQSWKDYTQASASASLIREASGDYE